MQFSRRELQIILAALNAQVDTESDEQAKVRLKVSDAYTATLFEALR